MNIQMGIPMSFQQLGHADTSRQDARSAARAAAERELQDDLQLSDEELEAVAGGWSTDQGVSSCKTTCDTKASACVTGSSICKRGVLTDNSSF